MGRSDGLTVGGLLPLLWETLQRLGYTEPPMYYCREYNKEGVLKCEVCLHIPKHPSCPAFQPRYVIVFGRECHDTVKKQHVRLLQNFVKYSKKILSTLQLDSFLCQTRPLPHGVRRFGIWEKLVPRHQSIRMYSTSDTCMHWTLSLKTNRRSYQDGSPEPRRLRMSYTTPPWNYIWQDKKEYD